MDHIKLETFITVVNTGSINKAANQLDLAPVSIKRQLDAIENELGVQLLVRTSYGSQLTDAGKIYYDFANNTLKEYEDAKNKINKLTDSTSNTIIICTGIGYSTLPLDLFSTAFISKYPTKKALYLPCDSETWTDLVKSRKADCAFITQESYEEINEPSISFIPMYPRKYMLIVHPNDPLASLDKISLAMLKGKTVHFNSYSFPQLLEAIHSSNIHFKQMTESPSASLVFNIIASGEYYITLDPIDQQYVTLSSVEIDFEPIICGWITLPQLSNTLSEYIELSKIVAKKNHLI